MSKINIVILGAGYGGVTAAKKLAKKYNKNDNIQITLIDKNPYHTLMTELHEVAGGRVDAESVMVDLRSIFYRSKVSIVTDKILKADVDKQVLYSGTGEYAYDYLVLGTGSETNSFGAAGVLENSFSLLSVEDALKIREHIKDMFKKAALEKDEKLRKEMLTFVVAGGSFTGIETIGEIMEWKTKLCKEYNVDKDDVTLLVVEALPLILHRLNEDQGNKAEKYMNKKGIGLRLSSPIVEVAKKFVKLKDGTVIPTQTLIWTCGVQGNEAASKLGLAMGRGGRVQTNDYMQSVTKENVYVTGDIAYYVENKKAEIPQIVETALQTADVAVANIAASIENKEKVRFKSNYHGFMVSIGGRYGVAHVGSMNLSGFFAVALKHLVNMHYLFGIGGFYLTIQYLLHEFFNIKERRSIVGGHLSAKAPTFWLVPLRLYLGVIWLIEGINKVRDGWLLSGHIYIVPVDAASSATQPAGEVAKTASTVVPLLKNSPEFYSAFMKTFVAPHAYFFQVCIVLAEIAIGLALLAGLFTFLASLASIFLCFNFILSAMAGVEIFWYIFAAVTLMGGAGRAFGLDYYLMPWIFDKCRILLLGKNIPVYKEF